MINVESKTLRDFSLRTTTKRGEKIIIKYGYDMSGRHSGYYVTASVNGGNFSNSLTTLRKVRTLKITAINDLIDMIGTDVTGLPENFEDTVRSLLETYIEGESTKDWIKLMNFYRIHSDNIDGEVKLAGMVEKYFAAKTARTQTSILRRFNKNMRVSLIENAKGVIKGLYTLYNEGTVSNGKRSMPNSEGFMKRHYYAAWYKRDIDYIRKARVKLFRDVLKRTYTPSGR